MIKYSGNITSSLSHHKISMHKKEEMDYLFVLPGITFYPSGGYKIVYELAKELAGVNKRVGILFVRDVYRNLAKTVTDPALKTYVLRDNSHYSIFSRLFNHRIIYTLLPFVRRLFGVVYRENLKGVSVYFSKGELPNVCVKRAIANGWQCAFFVRDFPDKIRKYNFIQQEDDDPSCNGDMAPLAGSTYDFDLQKIVINEEMRKRFNAENPGKVRVGIDSSMYPMITPIENKKNNVILMPIRKGEYKGASNALEAAKLMHQEYGGLDVKTFGNYDPGSIPDFIDHKGTVSDSELAELYNQASIFVLPSVIEGTPLTPLEAMSAGAAIVSTDNKGIREYIVNGKNGLLVPINDPVSLKDAVLQLVRNPEMRRNIAAEGNKTAQVFTYDNLRNDFLMAIDHIEQGNETVGSSEPILPR